MTGLSAPAFSTLASEVTFTRDVAPIFLEHCGDCHREGGIAPLSLTSYRAARPWAKAIRRQDAPGRSRSETTLVSLFVPPSGGGRVKCFFEAGPGAADELPMLGCHR